MTKRYWQIFLEYNSITNKFPISAKNAYVQKVLTLAAIIPANLDACIVMQINSFDVYMHFSYTYFIKLRFTVYYENTRKILYLQE